MHAAMIYPDAIFMYGFSIIEFSLAIISAINLIYACIEAYNELGMFTSPILGFTYNFISGVVSLVLSSRQDDEEIISIYNATGSVHILASGFILTLCISSIFLSCCYCDDSEVSIKRIFRTLMY